MQIRRWAWLAIALGAAACGDTNNDEDSAASGAGAASGSSSSSSSGSGGGCDHACDDGDGRCDGSQPERCITGPDGCRVWEEQPSCGADTHCVEGTCAGCSGEAGTFSDVALEVDGETRRYFLHVPASYACGTPAALVIDFHGTAVAGADDAVEEFYALEGLLEVADAEGFLVARPRSRSAEFDGGLQAFQWDINPGDLDRNVAFTHALVDDLRARYDVDGARMYASGFSNGTNMAAQFLGDDPPVFAGYAVMAGGVWSEPSPPDLSQAPPRIYATTGYRDYMFQWQRALVDLLGQHGLARQLFVRETDTGHELYGWHFEEAFAWLDRGEAPDAGEVAAAWVSETIATEDSLLQLARAGDGFLAASSTAGDLWRRDPTAGTWAHAGSMSAPGGGSLVTDLCIDASGHGIAIGEGAVSLTDDGGASWNAAPPVPEFIDMGFGFSYLNAVGCGATHFVGGGYWAAANSDDDGASWSEASMLNEFGYASQIAGIAENPTTGTTVAVGYYDYVGRSVDHQSFAPASPPVFCEWFTDVAAAEGGRFWVVGEAGTIVASDDDGLTWTAQSSGTDADLYAVDFLDAQRGVAVGARGTVVITTDGGATWSDLSTGLDHFVGDAVWLDAYTLVVAGGGGTVLRAVFAEPAVAP